MSKGIVIGSDDRAAWQIPLWYEAYRDYCTLPVAMADFGLSANNLRLCLDCGFQVFDAGVECGRGYLGKPVAIRKSPFEWTLWLDLDCEIRADVDPIFDEAPTGFGVIRLDGRYSNVGVVVVRRENDLLAGWTTACLVAAENEQDEEIFNRLVATGMYEFDVLDHRWNRGGPDPEDIECFIYHYFGPTGKQRLAAKHGLTIGQIGG